MSQPITLLPYPQTLTLTGGTVPLHDNKLIALDVPDPASLFFTAQQARRALFLYTGKIWRIVGGGAIPPEQIGLRITLDPAAVAHTQGYHLSILPDAPIILQACDTAGAFYGVMTFIQLLRQYGELPNILNNDLDAQELTRKPPVQTREVALPAVEITDWPDFPRRGVMLDISRDKVPTMKTLFRLVDLLASWKINELQLYTEHTFAYQRHPDVWAKADPITAAQAMTLDAYCRERFIDLVPNQNSFGHMHRWFEHAQYRPLAETEAECVSPWGTHHDLPYSLSPAVPGALDLVDEMFDELLPNFTSQYLNVGCDETWDIGMGRSKALCEEKGEGRVYLDFLLEIHRRVMARGRTMQFWGDIIGNHPELVAELPKDAVAMEWGYEADHNFPQKCAQFAASGIPFYVCPGTSSWNTMAGRTDNAMGNIRSAVENGLKHGAIGVLNTDWGDGGHWQPLPVSYLGFAHGAALSWAFAANTAIDLPAALDAFVFEDKAGVMGKLVYDLGNVYQKPGYQLHNGSALFRALPWALGDIENWKNQPLAVRLLENVGENRLSANLHAAIEAIDSIITALDDSQMTCMDAHLIKEEYRFIAAMLRHGARRILTAIGEDGGDLIAEFDALQPHFKRVWLARNRPGGLEDSLMRLRGERPMYE